VAEPLPKQDERQALLFYEAAEGGAGVLTRLATEPQAMAQVAVAALRVMHYQDPVGPWLVDDLPALEQKTPDGHSICEAGCYQCLLSYFNQPDHDHINRRNTQAIEMLVALANAQVAVSPAVVGDAGTHDALFYEWQHALQAGGHKAPDQTQLQVLGGQLTVAGQYKAARTLVILRPLQSAWQAELTDKGWTVINMSNSAQWSEQFAAYPHVFC